MLNKLKKDFKDYRKDPTHDLPKLMQNQLQSLERQTIQLFESIKLSELILSNLKKQIIERDEKLRIKTDKINKKIRDLESG